MIKVQCLDNSEQLYLIDRHGFIDVYMRHMVSASNDEDEANMRVSIKLEELEKAIKELKHNDK